MVVLANEPICKDSVITISYTSLFSNTPKNERQEALKQGYHFECKCKACEGDWPLFDDLPFGEYPDLKKMHLDFVNTHMK